MKIQYYDNGDLACFNGYSFRRDKKTGYYLSSRKIGDKRKRLHVYVWECAYGEIPKGNVIHHKDKNKANNELENLELMEDKEHERLHGKDRADEMREKLIKYAQPKAIEWHKSEAGREWHAEHAKQIMKDRQAREYKCTYCGKLFQSRKIQVNSPHSFCSNNCKSAYRRKMGFDNVKKICKVCGGEYFANKYQNTSRCEDCRRKRNRT